MCTGRKDFGSHCFTVMLIDFADKVAITVQVLGHTFLALCSTLHLEVKILDPSLYIDVCISSVKAIFDSAVEIRCQTRIRA